MQRFCSRQRHMIPGGHTQVVLMPLDKATDDDLSCVVETTTSGKSQAIGEPAPWAGVAEVRWQCSSRLDAVVTGFKVRRRIGRATNGKATQGTRRSEAAECVHGGAITVPPGPRDRGGLQ
jgi:hypothetical protein